MGLEEFGTELPEKDDKRKNVDNGILKEECAPINPKTINTESENNDYAIWAVLSSSKFAPTFPTRQSIPEGMYKIENSDIYPVIFSKMDINVDSLLNAD